MSRNDCLSCKGDMTKELKEMEEWLAPDIVMCKSEHHYSDNSFVHRPCSAEVELFDGERINICAFCMKKHDLIEIINGIISSSDCSVTTKDRSGNVLFSIIISGIKIHSTDPEIITFRTYSDMDPSQIQFSLSWRDLEGAELYDTADKKKGLFVDMSHSVLEIEPVSRDWYKG